MNSPLTLLLRVKKLKEEQALKEKMAKRQAAQRAAEETERARLRVLDSASTLESRQDAVYQKIIGQVIKLDDIEMTKIDALKIEKQHGKLIDAENRCVHVQADAEKERDEAIVIHRKAASVVDKYVILTDQEKAERAALLEQNEEKEIEDLFGARRKALA